MTRAMDPIELLIAGAVLLVFFVMGPKKIPELARAIGQAKGEFAAGAAQKPSTISGLVTTFASSQSAAASPSADAVLVETAEKLGIPTQGKTSAEISEAIVSKAKS